MSRSASSSLVRGNQTTNGFNSGRPHQTRARCARVALIGDEYTTRFLIETILLPTGEFSCAGQYTTFKAALMDLPEVCPDMILIDAGLRALPGIDGVRKLQALKPRPVIVWVTDPMRLRRLKNSFKSDACVFLMKPISKEACLGHSASCSPIARSANHAPTRRSNSMEMGQATVPQDCSAQGRSR